MSSSLQHSGAAEYLWWETQNLLSTPILHTFCHGMQHKAPQHRFCMQRLTVVAMQDDIWALLSTLSRSNLNLTHILPSCSTWQLNMVSA